MEKIDRSSGMRQVVDRWFLGTVLAYLMIKALQLLKKFVPPKEDPWRKASRAYLSAEHGKFGFGYFGVKPFPDTSAAIESDFNAALAIRFADFLKDVPISHITLRYKWLSVKLGRKETCDILLAQYAGDGTAVSFRPFLQGGSDLPHEREQDTIAIILNAYNETLSIPDRVRPGILRNVVLRRIHRQRLQADDKKSVIQFACRVLTSVCINVTQSDRENSFQDPEILRTRPPGGSPLQFTVRCDYQKNDADIWVYCNHAAEDGEPVMAMMENLAEQWGRSRQVFFPESGFRTKPVHCSAENEAYVHAAMYLDFKSFFAERARLKKTYGIDVPVLALLSWVVSIHPAFSKFKFTLPVCLDADTMRDRSLGMIYLRPSKYFDPHADEFGLLNYLTVFNRRLQETRRGRSADYEMMESFSLTPCFTYRMTLSAMPRAMENILGTAGLSVVKGAPFFIGTLSDAAKDCFLAFGNMNLPTSGGGTVGAVSIKGEAGAVERYADALTDIFDTSRSHVTIRKPS